MTKLLRKMAVVTAWLGLLLSPTYSRAEDSDSSLLSDWDLACNYVGVMSSSGEIAFYDTLSGDVNTSSTSTEFNNEPATDPSKTSLKDAVVTLSDMSLCYSGVEQGPTVTVTLNDTPLTQGMDYTVSGTASATDAGLYVLSVSGAGDYSGTWDAGWSITSKVVTATAKSYTVNLGDAAPTYEVEYEGFANNETDSVLTMAPALTCAYDAATAQEGESFPISFSAPPASKNYTFVCVPGAITVSSVYTITIDPDGGSEDWEITPSRTYTPKNEEQVFYIKNLKKTYYYIAAGAWTITGPANADKSWAGWTSPNYWLKIPANTAGDINMKVSWYKNKYTLKFNANALDADGVMSNVSGTGPDLCEIPDCGFVRKGYRFVEWNDAEDGTGSSYIPNQSYQFSIGNGSSKTLYAQWEQTHYILGYDNLYSTLDLANSKTTFHVYPTDCKGSLSIDPETNTIIMKNGNGGTSSDNRMRFALKTGAGFATDTAVYSIPVTSGKEYSLMFDVIKTTSGDNDYWHLDFWDGSKTSKATQRFGAINEIPMTANSEEKYVGPVTVTYTPQASYVQIRFMVGPNAGYQFSNVKFCLSANAEASRVTSAGAILPENQPLGDALVTPERAGYVFQGWKDAAGNAVTSETVMPASSLTIYSQWKQLVYVEGLVAESRSYEYGNKQVSIDSSNAKLVDADGNKIDGLSVTWPEVGTIASDNVARYQEPPEEKEVTIDSLILAGDSVEMYELIQPELKVKLSRATIQATVPSELVVTYDGEGHYLSEVEVLSSHSPGQIREWHSTDGVDFELYQPEDSICHVDQSGTAYLRLSDDTMNFIDTDFPYTVTITPAPLTAQATVNGQSDGSVSIFYGDPIPELGIAYTGFVEPQQYVSGKGLVNVPETPETAYNFTAPTVSTDYTPSSPARTYTVTVEGGSAGDYEITRQSTTFEVVEPTYTITMNAGEGGTGGGSVESGYQFNATESQEFVLPKPTRLGYHISVEETNSKGIDGPSGTTIKYYGYDATTGTPEYYTIVIPAGVRGNIEITPVWDANYYKIVYNNNATNTSDNIITTIGAVADQEHCLYDQDVILAENGFTRAGYAFKGWKQVKSGSGTLYTAGQTVTKPNFSADNNGMATLYAQWERTGYELGYDNLFSLADFAATTSFKVYGSSTGPEGTIEVDLGVGSVKLNYGTKKYYGYARTPRAESPGSTYYSMTLEPNTDYCVSFTVEGSGKYGLSFYEHTCNTNFGWSSSHSGAGSKSYEFTTNEKGTYQIVFWNFTQNSSVTFSNIRVVKADRAEQAAKTESVRKLVTAGAAVGELEEPIWTGYAFLGWNTAEDGSGTTFNETSTITASTPLFSQWAERTATVRVVLGKETIALGAAAPSYDYVVEGSIAGEDPTEFITGTPVYTTTPVYQAGKPTGTYTVSLDELTSEEYVLTFVDDSFRVVNSEMVNKYPVTMCEEAGATAEKLFDYVSSDSEQHFAITTPVREGYSIMGWTIEPEPAYSRGGAVEISAIDGSADRSLTIPAGAYGPVTLTPTWQQSACLLTFHLNDGSDTTAVQAFAAGETKALKTLAEMGFSRKNYRFKGWSKTGATGKFEIADGAVVTPFAETDDPATANADYYAIWEKIPLAFFFDANGGTALTDNARVIPQGDLMTHNANIYPLSNRGYFTFRSGGASETASYDADDMTLVFNKKNTGTSKRYIRWNVNQNFDCVLPGMNFVDILDVLTYDDTIPEGGSYYAGAIKLENPKEGDYPTYYNKIQLLSGNDISFASSTEPATTGIVLKNVSCSKSDTVCLDWMIMAIDVNHTLNAKWRMALFAGRAVTKEMYEENRGSQGVVPFEGYIECAFPEPRWTGMQFKGWNTKVDGTGVMVTEAMTSGTTLGDGTVLGREGELTTLYAVWEPSATGGTYYWNKSTSGMWDPSTEVIGTGTDDEGQEYDITATGNWWSLTPDYIGFPNDSTAAVVFQPTSPYGYAGATGPITISANSSMTIGSLSLLYGQPVTFDMNGQTLTTSGPITNAGTAVTFKNGKYIFENKSQIGSTQVAGTSFNVSEGADVQFLQPGGSGLVTFSGYKSFPQSLTIEKGGKLLMAGRTKQTGSTGSGPFIFGNSPIIGGLTTLDEGFLTIAAAYSTSTSARTNLYFAGGLIMKNGSRLIGARLTSVDDTTKTAYDQINEEYKEIHLYLTNLTEGVISSRITDESYISARSLTLSSGVDVGVTNSTISVSNLILNKGTAELPNTLEANEATLSKISFAADSQNAVVTLDNGSTLAGVSFDGEAANNNVVMMKSSITGSVALQGENSVKLMNESAIDATTFTIGSGSTLDIVLDSEVSVAQVNVSGAATFDAGAIIKVEQGSYPETDVPNTFIPLISFSTVPASLDATGMETLNANADIDAAFTGSKLVIVGKTLYLQLNPTPFTITVVDSADMPGYAASANSYELGYDNQSVTLTIPSKEGWEFKGWTLENDSGDSFESMSLATASETTLTIPARSVGNLTLTPNVLGKKRTVKYNPNCYTYGGTIDDLVFNHEDTGKVITSEQYTREAYEFKEWNTAADGKGTAYKKGDLAPDSDTESSVTLYAQWNRTMYGLGYENLFVLADWVAAKGTFRGTTSSNIKLTPNFEEGSITVKNLSVTDKGTTSYIESQSDNYYMIRTPLGATVYIEVYAEVIDKGMAESADEVKWSMRGYQFKSDWSSKVGSTLCAGWNSQYPETSVLGTGWDDHVQTKSNCDSLQVYFQVHTPGATVKFKNIRVYIKEQRDLVVQLRDQENSWGQSFAVDTPTCSIPDFNLTRSGLTFAGWNSAKNGSGIAATGSATDAMSYAPNNQSATLYTQWLAPIPVAREDLVYNRCSNYTGFVNMPATSIATAVNATGKNAGEYNAEFSLVDERVAWADGSAHGTKVDQEIPWSIAKCPLEIGSGVSLHNSEHGFNQPNNWKYNSRYWDEYGSYAVPNSYQQGANSTLNALEDGVDYAVHYYHVTEGVSTELGPTTPMPRVSSSKVSAGTEFYVTVLEGLGNYTGVVSNKYWYVERPTFTWKDLETGSWSDQNNWKPGASYLKNHLTPMSENQNATFANYESNIPVTLDLQGAEIDLGVLKNENAAGVTLMNGTINHQDQIQVVNGATLTLTNMTIVGTSSLGLSDASHRLYVAYKDSHLILAGDTTIDANTRIRFGPETSDCSLTFINGNIAVKETMVAEHSGSGDRVRNITFDNAIVKATKFEPATATSTSANVCRYTFRLGEKNTPDSDAMVNFSTSFKLLSRDTITVDATGKDAGTYKLITTPYLKDASGILKQINIVGVSDALSATIVTSGKLNTSKGNVTVSLQIARVYRALGNESNTPAIGVPDKWIEDLGYEPSSDPSVYEPIMEALNTKNPTSGISPMEAYIMGFSGTEAKNLNMIRPIIVQSTMEKVIQEGNEDHDPVVEIVPSISLKNNALTDWPTKESSESAVVYKLMAAENPSAGASWTQKGEATVPEFELPFTDLENAASSVKYYKIEINLKADSEKTIPKPESE